MGHPLPAQQDGDVQLHIFKQIFRENSFVGLSVVKYEAN